MSRLIRSALRSGALLAAVGAAAVAPAHGQQIRSVGDLYGIGAEGTIGRGTDNVPGGPSAPLDLGRWTLGQTPAGGPYVWPWSGPTGFYTRGYSGVRPAPTPPPAAPAPPYLTNRTYEPGDGYRYPLYYDPATARYLYYPVRR